MGEADDQATETPAAEPVSRRKRRSLVRRVLALLAAGIILFLAWEIVTWPRVGDLVRKNPTSTAYIRRDARRNHVPVEPLVWVPYERISPHLKRAALVSEDINFFTHDGFDRAEIRKAIEEAKRDREMPRGASTITMQLARNLWLSPSRTPIRKLKEAMLTRQLESTLDKKRILEIYLNVIEYGPGTWGITEASRRYFGTIPANLSERQAAELIAGLPRPSIWHPGSTSKTYRRRVERILGRMNKATFIWGQIGARRPAAATTRDSISLAAPEENSEEAATPPLPDSLE